VLLSLTVGTDGLAHDVTVTKLLGHGFDEQALRSVQEWRFEPAAKNGRPIPARITVQVDFSMTSSRWVIRQLAKYPVAVEKLIRRKVLRKTLR
jgi:TonB family protein